MSSASKFPAQREVWIAAGALTAAVLIAYADSFRGPFVYLDLPAIVDNPTIRHLGHLRQVLSPPTAGGVTVDGRPLVNLSLALNYAAGGLNPFGYHLANLLIHLFGALTLFGIVRRTVGAAGLGMALGAALLWAVHPLQTESVTYVVQRAESLMGLFYLLELYCFIRAVGVGPGVDRTPTRWGWAALSVTCCLLGMATKEVMVSAPLIVYLYDVAFVSGGWGAALRRNGRIHAARAATWILMAALALHTGGRGGTAGFGIGLSWWTYAQTQFVAIVHYLRLAVWPVDLDFYVTPSMALPQGEVMVCGLAVAALVAGTAAAWRFAPRWAFLGTFFFAILSPTSLIPGKSQTMAEHRMYLALAPLSVAGTWVLWSSLKRRRIVAWSLFGAIGIALMGLTWRRNQVYRSDESLWSDTVRKSPDNPYARNNLGIALTNLGRVPEAIAQFTAAARLNPGYPDAQTNLGRALMAERKWPEATAAYRAALQIDPNDVKAQGNLAVLLAAGGDLAGAIPHYRAVIRLQPGLPQPYYNLGNALLQSGQAREAAELYRRALRLDPSNAEAQANLGAALLTSGELRKAVGVYRAALAAHPGDPDLHYNLGLALRGLNRESEALAEFAEAQRERATHPAASP